MAREFNIGGVGVSEDVLATIITVAAARVEGVVQVGVTNDIATSLVSVLTSRASQPGPAIECYEEEGKLHIAVHLTVFYGYPFTKLANAVRSAVADALRDQAAAEPASIDICIDSLVFPKE